MSQDDPLYEFVMSHQGGRTLSPNDPDYGKYMELSHRVGAQKAKDADKTMWETIKPWLVGLAGGYLVLKGGDKWGRFAQKYNYSDGPVVGPLKASLAAFLPDDMKLRGTKTRQEVSDAQGK